ncbi:MULTISPECIES: hypothetical protein [unclassified Cryobacterium]|uniref:hypothetical protein n=1 Tax=unclassified Cryobacterium TaxID=2649013 RepID=UPI00106BCB22|nr:MULTISPECIES: hypothetical protein [unclassified Cryobacterium]TFD03669.1 hypothetical protein E3T29_17810 [Cryobacterium sp. TMT1-66-1]TFD12975.1 hypothetical protein E3T35_06765 [Cryobacterium sp. TMT1-2-2]
MTMTQKKKRKSQGLMTAIALGSLFAAFGASPANAAEVSPMSSEQVTLTDSQASALLLEADLPDQAASTYVLDPTDVEGWSIPGVVSFVSVGLDSPQTEVRSFLGAYFDTDGAQISTVEIAYHTDATMTSWTNGVKIDPADLNFTGQSQVEGNSDSDTVSARAATSTRDFCWYLNKYAEGEIAIGTLVAAAGGVAALFSGPVGGVIAAAGGLKAGLGVMYKWLISLWCL